MAHEGEKPIMCFRSQDMWPSSEGSDEGVELLEYVSRLSAVRGKDPGTVDEKVWTSVGQASTRGASQRMSTNEGKA